MNMSLRFDPLWLVCIVAGICGVGGLLIYKKVIKKKEQKTHRAFPVELDDQDIPEAQTSFNDDEKPGNS